MRFERCSRDGWQLLRQGLASIVRVAQGTNAKEARLAGEWLVAYGERLEQERILARNSRSKAVQAYDAESRDKIIDNLKALYAQALPSSAAQQVVEVTPEPEPAPERS